MPHGKRHDFSLESINKIQNGLIAEAFADELMAVMEDIEQRPALLKSRSLSMKVKVTPKLDTEASTLSLDSVAFQFTFDHSLPPRESKAYNLDIRMARGEDGRQQMKAVIVEDDSDDQLAMFPTPDQEPQE